MLMWCRKVSNQLLPFANYVPWKLYEKKHLINTLTESRERFHILEEACLYQRHITFSKTTATFGRQLLNLLVCLESKQTDQPTTDRKRSTGSHDSQPLTPSTRASLTVATQSFTSRMKSYCVAQLFIYCWSHDCFVQRTVLKDFWLKWASNAHTHTPLEHKHRERSCWDKNQLTECH